MISFDDDKFERIPMHSNHFFSPSMHGISFLDQEILNDDLIMLKNPINSTLFIKTYNHHSNVMEHAYVFNIQLKSRLDCWLVLQDGNHFWGVLIRSLSLLHALVGSQRDQYALCIVFQFMNHTSKIDYAFLYVKCHPTWPQELFSFLFYINNKWVFSYLVFYFYIYVISFLLCNSLIFAFRF